MNSVRAFEGFQGQKHEIGVIYQYKQTNALFVCVNGIQTSIRKYKEWNLQK